MVGGDDVDVDDLLQFFNIAQFAWVHFFWGDTRYLTFLPICEWTNDYQRATHTVAHIASTYS